MLVRKKRGEVKRLPPIELDITNPQYERLYDYVQRLTETGEAAQWIRAALVAALPARTKALIPTKLTSNGGSEPRYEEVED